MDFVKLENNIKQIEEMSAMAKTIVKDYYDPIIGASQNDYMINLFQSVEGITNQLNHGYIYYFVRINNKNIGFFAYYKRCDYLYLSKLYLYKNMRGKGYARSIISFLKEQAYDMNVKSIRLNVNKYNESIIKYKSLGFKIISEEKNDIGNGFYMDDYVMMLSL